MEKPSCDNSLELLRGYATFIPTFSSYVSPSPIYYNTKQELIYDKNINGDKKNCDGKNFLLQCDGKGI